MIDPANDPTVLKTAPLPLAAALARHEAAVERHQAEAPEMSDAALAELEASYHALIAAARGAVEAERAQPEPVRETVREALRLRATG